MDEWDEMDNGRKRREELTEEGSWGLSSGGAVGWVENHGMEGWFLLCTVRYGV